MEGQFDEARQRARRRRDENKRFSRTMLLFKAGEGGLDVLGDFVNNDHLILADRLDAVDVALQRDLINQDEISDPGSPPSFYDFGLKSEVAPTVMPDWLKATAGSGHVASNAAIITLISLAFATSASWTWMTSHSVTAVILNTPFLTLIGSIALGLSIAMFMHCVNSILPGAAAHRRYTAAQNRHKLLSAVKLLQAYQNDVHAYIGCSGPAFERLVARAFRRLGYRVEENGGANDGGVDLLVWRGNLHAIVQCKAHAKPVGPAVVRELLGALNHSKDASVAYLVTTKGVTASAEAWCKGKPIRLLLPDHLIMGQL